jgi:hypothetical protein
LSSRPAANLVISTGAQRSGEIAFTFTFAFAFAFALAFLLVFKSVIPSAARNLLLARCATKSNGKHSQASPQRASEVAEKVVAVKGTGFSPHINTLIPMGL